MKNFILRNITLKKIKLNYFKDQNENLTWWKNIFKDRIDKFEKILGRKGAILDVGCGPGFLKYAKSRGWKTVGIFFIEKLRIWNKKKLNLDIKKLNIEQISKLGNLKFDVIYSHGVLEHLRKPIEYINLLRTYCKKDLLSFPL